jgi:glycosyltransferase involved in cell wall biosynthesis
MKILQVIYSLTSGGAERFVIDLSNELVKDNEVYLLTIKDENISINSFFKPDLSQKIKYINAGFKEGLTIKKMISLYKTIKVLKPDIVHFHLRNTAFFILIAILFYRRPVYFETLHTRADISNTNRITYYIYYLIYRFRFANICTISDANRDSFLKHYKIKDTALIYNGRAISPDSGKLDSVKKEIDQLKNSPNDLVFLHIGRCVNAKNQRTLVASFNKLYDAKVNFILLIIGSGFDSEEGDYLKRISCQNIHFLGTRVNVADYFRCADAFCLTSIYEGMPITLIESFAYGCVPISTPVSGAVDIIENGVTGFLSEGLDDNSYFKVLESFIDKRNEIDKQKLISYYEANFSIHKCSMSYLEVYNQIIKKRFERNYKQSVFSTT